MAAHVKPPARRARWDASMWSVVVAVPLAVAVAVVFNTRVSALLLAGYFALAAAYRALAPDPGPAAFSVRARWMDVVVLAGAALVVGALGLLAPPL